MVGDRGYDDGENHEFLSRRGIGDALHLNRYRTEKKDRHKEPWLRLQAGASYRRGLRQRYRVEQKFGELKRLVKLVSGVPFRYQPPPPRLSATGDSGLPKAAHSGWREAQIGRGNGAGHYACHRKCMAVA